VEREKWKYKGVERSNSTGIPYYVWHRPRQIQAFGATFEGVGHDVYVWPVHAYRAATTGGSK
jgi:hypothetical protein